MKKYLLVLVALLTFVIAPAARADLVNNGGFETSGTYVDYGLFTAPGWTIADKSGATGIHNVTDDHGYNGTYGLTPATGNAFLWGGAYWGNIGSVSQTLATTIGQTYSLDFMLANGGNGTPNSFSVQWNNQALTTLTNAPDASAYAKYAFLVTGTGSDTLQFNFNHEPTAWALDNVSVNPVPLPGALLLFGPGLAGLVSLRKRFTA